jgi:excisionase family DNA binding protein
MNSAMPLIQLVSIGRAAEFLDVSRSTVRRLIKSKLLPAVKIGGQLRIRVADLHALIEKQANNDDEKKEHNGEKSHDQI